MSARRIRVLVVDDSAFARKVIRDALEASPDLEVVGTARDGLDALEKLSLLQPDVVTLDLVMPGLDGLGFLATLPPDPPRVVVVSSSDDESEIVVTALQRGALSFVKKPTTQASERLLEIGAPLIEAVRSAMGARVLSSRDVSATVRAPLSPRRRVVVVGASTGGPQALTRLFGAFPSDWIVPIATVLHLPAGYTEAFAKRLDEGSALTIREAHDAMIIAPGMAVVAKGGVHLEIVRGALGAPEARLGLHPIDALHRPSVDVLFASAAAAFGADVVAVVLTGMGADGREGARAIRDAGGVVLSQSAASCVVYGMPRSVEEAGLSTAVVAMDEMAAAIADRVA